MSTSANETNFVTSTFDGTNRTFYDKNGNVILTTSFDTTEDEVYNALYAGALETPVQSSGEPAMPVFNDPTRKYAEFIDGVELRPIGTVIDASVTEPMAGDKVYLPEIDNPFMKRDGGLANIDEVRSKNGDYFFTTTEQPGVVWSWDEIKQEQEALKLKFS